MPTDNHGQLRNKTAQELKDSEVATLIALAIGNTEMVSEYELYQRLGFGTSYNLFVIEMVRVYRDYLISKKHSEKEALAI